MCFLSSTPSLGIGRLVNRDDKKAYGTPKEKELLQPASPWYKEIAHKAATDQVWTVVGVGLCRGPHGKRACSRA